MTQTYFQADRKFGLLCNHDIKRGDLAAHQKFESPYA